MKTLQAGSYQRLASQEALWWAWRDCRRGKRGNPTIARFEIDCDRHLLALQRELLDYRYRPSPWRLHCIHDPKTRLIAAPAVRDRVLHHAVLQEIGPLFESRYIEQSFAAGHHRGPHRAVLYFLGCQRRYAWRLHLDIRAYFLSISHTRLLALFGERIVDTDTLELLRLIIASGDQVYGSQLAATTLGERCPPAGQGLPLGSWFSQWCENFYLDGLDHFVKRTLKIPGYQRYMDDCVLFADGKTQLLEARTAIAAWLQNERALDLNPKHLAIEPTHTSAVFLGYRVSRGGSHRVVNCVGTCVADCEPPLPGKRRRCFARCSRIEGCCYFRNEHSVRPNAHKETSDGQFVYFMSLFVHFCTKKNRR